MSQRLDDEELADWRAGRNAVYQLAGLEKSLGTRLVIYADDLVILCRRGNAEACARTRRETGGATSISRR